MAAWGLLPGGGTPGSLTLRREREEGMCGDFWGRGAMGEILGLKL